MTLARSTFVLGVVAMLAVTGCDDNWITPQPSKDAPTFKISNFVVGSGQVDQAVSTASGTVNTTGLTTLMEMITVSHPTAGIHSLHVEISQPAPFGTRYLVDWVVEKRSDGTVPASLSLMGYDGAHGPGDKPMQFAMLGTYHLTATATTFERVGATIELDFKTWGAVSATLSQNLQTDGSTLLSWNTDFAANPPTLVPPVTGFGGFTGSTSIKPMMTTTFTLTAANPFGSASDSETVKGTDLNALAFSLIGPASSSDPTNTSPVVTGIIVGGNWTSGTATTGTTTIATHPLTKTFKANELATFAETFTGLRQGSWTIGVISNGLTHSCTVTVPGTLTMDTRPTAPKLCG